MCLSVCMRRGVRRRPPPCFFLPARPGSFGRSVGRSACLPACLRVSVYWIPWLGDWRCNSTTNGRRGGGGGCAILCPPSRNRGRENLGLDSTASYSRGTAPFCPLLSSVFQLEKAHYFGLRRCGVREEAVLCCCHCRPVRL